MFDSQIVEGMLLRLSTGSASKLEWCLTWWGSWDDVMLWAPLDRV